MPYYMPSYDTEAIFPWWELGGRKYSAQLYQAVVSYEGERLHECLDGIRAVAAVHLRLDLPGTFFLVARLLESARSEIREILGSPLFDVQCHSYTHANLAEAVSDKSVLRHELADSKHLIEDTFGRPVIGLTTPGGFSQGLIGQPSVLEMVWEAGYKYLRSVGLGPFDSVPAPLTQPFWYTPDGFPGLLELALHAWHDNHLTGQPGVSHWPPVLPWGYPARVASTAEEAYDAYAPGIDYIAENGLVTYVPCLHPWSIYRLERRARHVELLLEHARKRVKIATCTSVYETIRDHRALASEGPLEDVPKPVTAAVDAHSRGEYE